ncbi:MAG: hypothetical protein AAB581_00690 [Patescibacteria group bacterium]
MKRAAGRIAAVWGNIRDSYDFLFDGYILSMIGATGALHLGLWYYLNTNAGPPEAFIPLHFTYAFGVDLIGRAAEMYYVAYWAIAFSIVNILCARFAYRYDILAAYFLASALPLVHGIMLFESILVMNAGVV